VVLFSLGFTTAGSVLAQDTPKPIVIGEEHSIRSAILNEDRRILIGKPVSYDRGEARYPVLFVLDGPDHFHHTTGATQFLARNGFMPEVLVVAIPNTDRTRDLTPPSQDPVAAQQMPTHGGAASFRAFIADELVPWLDATYRTRPYRMLVGHSFGGLFAIDTLVARPELFNAYIAISPSLQWNEQRLVEQAEAFFDGTPELKAALFMTAGNEGNALLGGARKLAGVLDEKAPKGFEWHFEHMPAETHGSVPLRSTYQGLEFIFADWFMRNAREVYESYGIEAVESFYDKSDEKYGFDRGVPDQAVAAIAQPLFAEGRFDEVADLLSRYRETLRPPPPFLIALANGYRDRGNMDRAIEWYRRVLETDTGNEAARKALAELGQSVSD
jgi:predicted alpha/beta superfamily hydrolase